MTRYLFAVFASISLVIPNAHAARHGDWQEIEGVTYSVPVDEDLKPFAMFPMQFKSRLRDGRLEVEYTLPLELTGHEISVQAKSVDDKLSSLSGPQCLMNCRDGDCAVNYQHLGIDPNVVKSYLASHGFSDPEIQSRMKVLGRFMGGDPAGIIHMPR